MLNLSGNWITIHGFLLQRLEVQRIIRVRSLSRFAKWRYSGLMIHALGVREWRRLQGKYGDCSDEVMARLLATIEEALDFHLEKEFLEK